MKVVWLLGTVVLVLALAIASLISLPKKLVFNASASAPIGFYGSTIGQSNAAILSSLGYRSGSATLLNSADICRPKPR